MDRWQPPFLLQRLKRSSRRGVINPFAFGGGLRHGGLSEEIAREFAKFLDFDYMGAGQYEMGALPQALSRMYSNWKDYSLSTLYLFPKELKFNLTQRQNFERPKEKLRVDFACHNTHSAGCAEFIRGMASGKFKVRDPHFFIESVSAPKKPKGGFAIAGWIDLTNSTFITTDSEMRDGFVNLMKKSAGGF